MTTAGGGGIESGGLRGDVRMLPPTNVNARTFVCCASCPHNSCSDCPVEPTPAQLHTYRFERPSGPLARALRRVRRVKQVRPPSS